MRYWPCVHTFPRTETEHYDFWPTAELVQSHQIPLSVPTCEHTFQPAWNKEITVCGRSPCVGTCSVQTWDLLPRAVLCRFRSAHPCTVLRLVAWHVGELSHIGRFYHPSHSSGERIWNAWNLTQCVQLSSTVERYELVLCWSLCKQIVLWFLCNTEWM